VIAAVVPAKDEEGNVGDVVRGVAGHVDLVVVVDDGSTDNTGEEAREAGALVLKLSKNKGKGYALRKGVERALKEGADALVFIDADGQHRPGDVPRFLEALEESDIVFGQREGGDPMPPVKRLGNWGLNLLFRVLFGYHMEDTQCGFRAVKASAVPDIMWQSDGYFVDTEVAARAGMAGLETRQVAIETRYLDASKGTGVADGFRIAAGMFSTKFFGK
jgi:glycosyltransferase involved in cell wall biosynthesis